MAGQEQEHCQAGSSPSILRLSFDPAAVDRVRAALVDLPSSVGLLHPRAVVAIMFTLRVRHQLNVRSAEALAVGLLLQARLVATTEARCCARLLTMRGSSTSSCPEPAPSGASLSRA